MGIPWNVEQNEINQMEKVKKKYLKWSIRSFLPFYFIFYNMLWKSFSSAFHPEWWWIWCKNYQKGSKSKLQSHALNCTINCLHIATWLCTRLKERIKHDWKANKSTKAIWNENENQLIEVVVYSKKKHEIVCIQLSLLLLCFAISL